MSSYAHFGIPTCRQAAMQTLLKTGGNSKAVCFSEKAAAKKYYLSVVSSLTYCIYASTLRHQTANSIHLYRGLPTSGRAKMSITTYYSYIHVRTKSIYIQIHTN